jgi:hypothetical protein
MTSETREDRVAEPSEIDIDKSRDDYESSNKSRFKFKSKRRSRHSDDGGEHPDSSHRSRRDRERHHRHHQRSKRHRRYPSPAKDDPALYDDTHLPNASSSQYMDPEVAFRESLFDAMADDEGAQFWEGVYGQPIHHYPDVKEGPTGELERMTDEEYAAHVRAKMYEKTHQHLIEEKARREAAKKERARLEREGRKEEEEAKRFRRKVEESLKRGEERKNRKVWAERWEAYVRKWDNLSKGRDAKVAIASIPWPVESGKKNDIDFKGIERFFLHAPTSGQPTEAELGKILKLERIRWHPDKIQQKLGGQDVDEDVMQAVTKVFQFIDRMWTEIRDLGGKN